MTVARLLQQGGLPHRHDRQVAPRAATPSASIAGRSCRDRASTGPGLLHRDGREDLHGPVRHRRHRRSGASTSSRSGRANKPFFLMLHHKAPHRPWEPDDTHRAQFADRWIPGAGDVLGRLRDAHGRAAREPAARREGPHATRSQAAAAAGPRGRELHGVAGGEARHRDDRARRR